MCQPHMSKGSSKRSKSAQNGAFFDNVRKQQDKPADGKAAIG